MRRGNTGPAKGISLWNFQEGHNCSWNNVDDLEEKGL